MTTTQTVQPTKRQMAEALADSEVSVKWGVTRRSYWVNQYMGMRKTELTSQYDRRIAKATR